MPVDGVVMVVMVTELDCDGDKEVWMDGWMACHPQCYSCV